MQQTHEPSRPAETETEKPSAAIGAGWFFGCCAASLAVGVFLGWTGHGHLSHPVVITEMITDHERQAQLDQQEEDLTERASELTALEEDLDTESNRLTALREALQKREEDIDARQDDLFSAAEQWEEYAASLDERSEEINEISAQWEQAVSDLEDREQGVAQREELIDERQSQIDQLTEELIGSSDTMGQDRFDELIDELSALIHDSRSDEECSSTPEPEADAEPEAGSDSEGD